MTTRTSSRTVTFTRPFSLSGVDGVQPAGTYVVETDEERLDGLSFPAYRRVATVIYLAPPAGRPGTSEIAAIDPAELEAALERDASPQDRPLPGFAAEPAFDDLLDDDVFRHAVRSARLTTGEFREQWDDLATRMSPDPGRRRQVPSAPEMAASGKAEDHDG
ncbi:MAG TPA: hypothetical protein VFO41_08705 [Alphaproteobacteria bacterium]|nr:hypothetical protein [Alphaproteobacteria bacterium]